MNYRDLLDVDLGKLGTAAGTWEQAVKHLQTLSKDAHDGLKTKADTARWAGVNATVTREFVDKTAKECADLHSEGASWTTPTRSSSACSAGQKVSKRRPVNTATWSSPARTAR
ncbi:hypothetical protein ACH4UM_25620 [Streptomyces sp. NPDC020801]|uniref:hypothetical protein n=1 Tax=unclassified Streptomyces TaxID=2593676 RepID=UPI0037BABF45